MRGFVVVLRCWKPTMRSFCSANISFSSSGSAWSNPRRCRRPCVVSRISSSIVECLAATAWRLGDLRAQHDVAEQPWRRRHILGARAQLVHRKAQHVGRAGLVHPLDVQRLHRALVDEDDRHIGVGADVQLGEVVLHEPQQHGLVDRDRGLVVDLDGHERPRFGRWSCGPGAREERRSARLANSDASSRSRRAAMRRSSYSV